MRTDPLIREIVQPVTTMKQISLGGNAFELSPNRTRKREFLAAILALVI